MRDNDIFGENTPQVRFIQHRYERAGLQYWNNNRVSQLAKDLSVTVWTLCAWAGAYVTEYDARRDLHRLKLDKTLIRRCWRTNQWPVLMTVNLERLENFVKTRDNIKGGILFGRIDKVGAEMLSGKVAEYG